MLMYFEFNRKVSQTCISQNKLYKTMTTGKKTDFIIHLELLYNRVLTKHIEAYCNSVASVFDDVVTK